MTSGNLGIAPVAALPLDRSGEMLHRAPSFSLEMQLLLCCGGPRIRAEAGERLQILTRKDLDWDLVLKVAMWHRMSPLLYWSLTHTNGDQPTPIVPPSALDSIRNVYVRNVSNSLRMTGELLGILDGMERAGVPAVPYKGPILSSRLYGNLGLRHSVDLDILVRKEDLREARRVLLDLEYVPSVMLHSTNQEFQVESRYSERFDRPGTTVELHWAFTNKDVAFPLSLNALMPRLVSYKISGRTIRVFSPEDTLLILCVHGAKHGWAHLEWLCGVAELLHGADMEWQDLLATAKETRGLRRLLLGLCLAHDLYQARLPEEIQERIRSDKQVRALANQVTSSLYVGDDHTEGLHAFGTLDHDLFHFRLGDRLPDSLRYLAYRMTTPSRPEKWSTIAIGKRFISLHSFTRPFGIAGKLIPAVWRRYTPNRRRKRGGK